MILALLQARMSSTRLPGKVLKPLAGTPMVLRQIERIDRSRRIDRLVVATSLDPSDDVLAQTLAAAGRLVHRGPLDDVLARFAGALKAHPADHVARLTADCPLADWDLIDATVDLHLASGADYTSNTPKTFAWPKGQDVEVMTAQALARTAAEATSPEGREHVTWEIWNRPDRFRLAWLPCPRDEGEVRWTVDTPDDYAFASTVYEALHPRDPAFTSEDVRAFLRSRPDLQQMGGFRRL